LLRSFHLCCFQVRAELVLKVEEVGNLEHLLREAQEQRTVAQNKLMLSIVEARRVRNTASTALAAAQVS
jgi:hypothetical protein